MRKRDSIRIALSITNDEGLKTVAVLALVEVVPSASVNWEEEPFELDMSNRTDCFPFVSEESVAAAAVLGPSLGAEAAVFGISSFITLYMSPQRFRGVARPPVVILRGSDDMPCRPAKPHLRRAAPDIACCRSLILRLLCIPNKWRVFSKLSKFHGRKDLGACLQNSTAGPTLVAMTMSACCRKLESSRVTESRNRYSAAFAERQPSNASRIIVDYTHVLIK